jgi:hypothetical protein
MINEKATDCRFIVFTETALVRTTVATVNTARGAASTLTRRQRRGEFQGVPSYGWQRQELVDGVWIDC